MIIIPYFFSAISQKNSFSGNGNISWVSKKEREAMGFYEEESKGTPPPWDATSYKEIHLQIFSHNMYKVTSGWLVVSD